jgi:hypothetical protein
MSIITIKEGNTNTFAIPAVGVLIVGLICLLAGPFIGFPVMLFGVTLFFVKSGMQIDTDGRRYRKYADYLGKKFGAWNTFVPCSKVVLQLSVESQSVANYFMVGGTGMGANGRTTFKSVTYDIMLVDQLGERMIFHEFMKYKVAREAVSAIANSLQLEYTDRVAEKLAENRERRGRH